MSTFILHTQSLGDLPIFGPSYLRMPGRGNWVAYVACFGLTPAVEGEPATLTIVPESIAGKPPVAPDVFTGTVRRSRVVPGSETLTVSMVGGKGHMIDTLPAPLVPDMIGGSTVLPAGLVLRKLADAAGEQIAPGVELALDAYTLPRWHVAGGTTVHDAIDMLVYDVAKVSGVALGWRMLAGGTIWAGVETWPAAKGAFNFIDQDADDGRMIYAPSGAPLRPGMSVAGERAIEVEYWLASPAQRAHVRHRVSGDPPTLPELEARALYLASYAARVEAQRDDGTIDVVCDDPRMGELLSVPFRMCIPGAVATLPAGPAGTGARVRVRFENGSPRGAYACDVDQDPSATRKFALVSDLICYLSATCAATPGPVTFIASPTPTGAPGEVALRVAGPGHRYLEGVPT